MCGLFGATIRDMSVAPIRRAYEDSHPWITFGLRLPRDDVEFWALLGEARSKIEHLRGVFLKPESATRLHMLYLAKGAHATTAIEGNTLSEEEALLVVEGRKSELPPSREYLALEIENIVNAWNEIQQGLLRGASRDLTAERICDYNAKVLAGLELEPGVEPGRVRQHSVGVGRYRGAPAEDCTFLLQSLGEWLASGDFVPPAEHWAWPYAVIKAAIAHVYLAWIHAFGDGNGRTARLVELQILAAAGIPTPATHLLSNHYNRTRDEYYRHLAHASESGGDTFPFVKYAIGGFVEGLREQLTVILAQQFGDRWEQFVYESFGEARTIPDVRRRQLVLDLSRHHTPVARNQLTSVSPEVAVMYAGRTRKTVTRDINVLRKMDLIEFVRGAGWRAKKSRISVFLPSSADGGYAVNPPDGVILSPVL
jgi:Fic family protein